MSDSQPASANRAVFLSYASQDAEAARRICESLRSGGVEVWFDADGGLEHGDEWDAKIRRQIKECVLFIPVISASTQARPEGYFRIEWDLAAERARGIASGVPFILPVVIDDTREPDALVPDRFRTVQWTKLRGGEVPPEVQQRFLKLWSHRTGVLKHQAADVAKPPLLTLRRETAGMAAKQPASRRVFAAACTVALVAALAAGSYFWSKRAGPSTRAAPISVKPPMAVEKPTAASSEAHDLVAKMWVELNKPELARAELEIADDLGKHATALNPQDGDAWAAWSQVDSWMIYHSFATVQERADSARTKVTRALGLAPDAFEPRLAQACFLVRGGGESGISTQAERAEALLRALLRERPAEPRTLLALGILLRNLAKPEETRATLLELAKNPAFAAQAWNELGWAAYHFCDWPGAEAAADRSLEIRPNWAALMLKFDSALWTRGDLALAKATLDRLPLNVLQEDWVVAENCEFYEASGQPEQVLRVLTNASRDWLRCGPFFGPTDYIAGLAHDMLNQPDAARLSWQSALKQVELRLASAPKSPLLVYWKAELLVRLGQSAEGEKFLRIAREIAAVDPDTAWWFPSNPQASMMLGDYDQAVRTLEANIAQAGQIVRWGRLELDPMLKPLHGRADFEALRKRVAADPRLSPVAQRTSALTAPTADDKSVAVLAFADNSPGHDSEYFSDGISEELINALGKVPGLKVPGSTSSFYFKGKSVPMPEIAKQLGVAYVIEGSVQRVGEKLKIGARLTKASDGFQVWTDSFLRDAKDVFAVEEEIAGLIAKQLSLKLGVSSAAVTVGVNPQAFEAYLQGRQAWNRRTAEGYAVAEKFFAQAITLDPNFARAYVGQADVLDLRGWDDGSVGPWAQRKSETLKKIRALLERAIGLDPNLAEAYASLGTSRYDQWDYPAALTAARRAVELNPNYATGWFWLGEMLWDQGEMDEALVDIRRAMEIDPYAMPAVVGYSLCLHTAGRTAEALAYAERAVSLQPDAPRTLSAKALALLDLGHTEAAASIARQLFNSEAGRTWWQTGMIVARAGLKDETADLVRQYRRPGDERLLAPMLAILDRWEEFFAVWQMRPVVTNQPWPLWEPFLDSVRQKPEFLRVLDQVGLTEAHARVQAWRAAHPPEKPAVK